jgi:hypothetical protein
MRRLGFSARARPLKLTAIPYSIPRRFAYVLGATTARRDDSMGFAVGLQLLNVPATVTVFAAIGGVKANATGIFSAARAGDANANMMTTADQTNTLFDTVQPVLSVEIQNPLMSALGCR